MNGLRWKHSFLVVFCTHTHTVARSLARVRLSSFRSSTCSLTYLHHSFPNPHSIAHSLARLLAHYSIHRSTPPPQASSPYVNTKGLKASSQETSFSIPPSSASLFSLNPSNRSQKMERKSSGHPVVIVIVGLVSFHCWCECVIFDSNRIVQCSASQSIV